MKTPVDYVFGTDLPEPGAVMDVAEGIRWIRMPLPFALDHVNLYLIDDGDGWVLIDTGIGLDETKGLWEKILAEALGGRPITQIIITHFHPDHMGCAGWLTEKLGVEMWTTRTEWLSARAIRLDESERLVDHLVAFYRKAGIPEPRVEEMKAIGGGYAKITTPIPLTYQRVATGQVLEIGKYKFTVIIGAGHSPEHICLHCPDSKVVLGGDFLLPRISPNVSVWWMEPDGNPLADYLQFLAGVTGIGDEELVLPSHDRPYRGLDMRVRDLALHHEERLELAESVCKAPSTANDVMNALFQRELDAHQTRFAVGESLSHLNFLLEEGRVSRRIGDDGQWLYETVS